VNALPLASADGLRIDMHGAPAIEKATFVLSGDCAVVAGDGYALLAAIAGQADIRAGTLLVLGRPPGGARARRDVGLAPLDPPFPAAWTAGDYLGWSSRLCLSRSSDARARAAGLLADLDIRYLLGAKIADLSLHERRALVIAHAVVAEPDLVVASAPLSGLSGEPAAYVAQVLRAATRGRKWIVSVANLHAGSPEHALAAQADELLVFSSGRLVHTGKSGIGACSVGYTVTVRGRIAALRAALLERGIELSGGPVRFWVDLPESTSPSDLLAISLEAGAPIVELCPRAYFGGQRAEQPRPPQSRPGVTPPEGPR
jgi:ABC-2 type transport system ATP-binding protein